MTVVRKRRLHVWEHHHLHPERTKKNDRQIPVHVVFEHDEFDYWMIDAHTGNLVVGWTVERRPEDMNENLVKNYGYVMRLEQRPFYIIAQGMYAKVELEPYEEDVQPTELFDQNDSIPYSPLESLDSVEMGIRTADALDATSKMTDSMARAILAEKEAEAAAREEKAEKLRAFVNESSEEEDRPESPRDRFKGPAQEKLVFPLEPRSEKHVIDSKTGVDLTHVFQQINPKPKVPESALEETRLDLMKPIQNNKEEQ